jgi:hypothetical protein
MKLRYGLLLLGFMISVPSCTENPERPSQLIPEEKYIDLLVELQLVNSYTYHMGADSTTIDSLTKEVFMEYGVTREAFMESHTYYQEFPKQQKERVDAAMERLRMDRVEDTTDTSGRPDQYRY